MPVTSRPAAWSERIAVSRPEPRPFTKTSTFWRACSMPFRAAASAVTCAANGVDLREPLKPAPPADSQAMTLPSRSVRDTMVLLKLVLMWPGRWGCSSSACGGHAAGVSGRASSPFLLSGLLLARDLHALGALASPGVRLRVLSADREAATVAQAAVAADLHQALDVLRALAAQVALDREVVVDQVAELGDLVVREIADVGVRPDPGLLEQVVGGRAADPVDVRQTDLDTLVQGDVDPGDSCHPPITPAAACVGGSGRSRGPRRGGG